VFAPEKGIENPIIRRAMELCEADGMKVIYHEDTVEVWFAPNNKRFYTTWSQFLADAETVFGGRLHEAPTVAPMRTTFGNRSARVREMATAGGDGFAEFGNGHATAHVNGHAHDRSDGIAIEPAAPPRRRASDFAPPDAAEQELARLRREVKVLERAIRVVGMQSEEWKREVENARRELDETRAEMANMVEARMALSGGGPDRYKQVRQIIVKRLHPDIAGTDEEKAHREKLFKSIWQDIEGLDKRG
jgi:hypothetical protein